MIAKSASNSTDSLLDLSKQVVLFSLACGWASVFSIVTAKNLEPSRTLFDSAPTTATLEKPVAVKKAEAPVEVARSVSEVKTPPVAKTIVTPSETKALDPSSAKRETVMLNGKDFLILDGHRIRVNEKVLPEMQSRLAMFVRDRGLPTVQLRAGSNAPAEQVRVVEAFIRRYYGWSVTTEIYEGPDQIDISVGEPIKYPKIRKEVSP